MDGPPIEFVGPMVPSGRAASAQGSHKTSSRGALGVCVRVSERVWGPLRGVSRWRVGHLGGMSERRVGHLGGVSYKAWGPLRGVIKRVINFRFALGVH